MAGKGMIARLRHLRALRLRGEIGRLKTQAAALEAQHELLGQALQAASGAIDSAHSLADLGALGDLRLETVRRAGVLRQKVGHASESVGRAKRLLDSCIAIHGELVARERAAHEQNAQTEAEDFFAWSRSAAGSREP